MSELPEHFIPNNPGTGKLGTATHPWGEVHALVILRDGSALAAILSPAFEGEPTAPSPPAWDDSLRIATTAWVRSHFPDLLSRANHIGTQTANTISDFNTAVGTSPTGQIAHAQGSDSQLVGSGDTAITADEILGHIADGTIHFIIADGEIHNEKAWSGYKINAELAALLNNLTAHKNDPNIHIEIDDQAGDGDDDVVWSAHKTLAVITSATDTGNDPIHIDSVIGAGALAKRNTVGNTQIDAGSIDLTKVEGGLEGDGIPENWTFWGTNGIGSVGIFAIHDAIRVKLNAQIAVGEGLLAKSADGLYVVLGTTANHAAAGDDARFPSMAQKSALDGASGVVGVGNKYLTESWAADRVVIGSDMAAATPSPTPGLVSAATLANTFALRSDFNEINLTAATPSPTPGLVSATQLLDKFAGFATADIVDALTQVVDGKLDAEGFAAQWEDGTVWDGDVLDVDYPPVYYAPRSNGVPEANDSGDLAAHLAGIDDKLGAVDGALNDIEANGVPADISGSDVLYTPVNYAPTSDTVAGHFTGVDNGILTPANIFNPAKLHADKLHIHWEPTHYTPTSVGISEVDDNSDLTAHLAQVSDKDSVSLTTAN